MWLVPWCLALLFTGGTGQGAPRARDPAGEAAAAPPDGVTLGATNENSVLYVDCEGTPPFLEVQCRFTRMDLTFPTIEEIEADLQEHRPEILKDWAKQRGDICKKIASYSPRADAGTPETRSAEEANIDLFRRSCACRDDDCVLREFETYSRTEERVCTVQAQSFTLDFKRVPGGQWVHQSLQGTCAIPLTATLERAPAPSSDWTFTQLRAPTQTRDPGCLQKELKSEYDSRHASPVMDISKACPLGRLKMEINW